MLAMTSRRPARAFAALCDRAADHGLVVGLEFVPFTDIVSVHDARRIVEEADRPNGGVCVDIWHHERGARDLAGIAALPGELITGIQLNDGALTPVDERLLHGLPRQPLRPRRRRVRHGGFLVRAGIDGHHRALVAGGVQHRRLGATRTPRAPHPRRDLPVPLAVLVELIIW